MARSSSKSRQMRQSRSNDASLSDSSDTDSHAEERAFELPRRARTKKQDGEADNFYTTGSSWGWKPTKKDSSRKILMTGGTSSRQHEDAHSGPSANPDLEGQLRQHLNRFQYSDPHLEGRHKMSWVPAVFTILTVVIIIVVVAVLQK